MRHTNDYNPYRAPRADQKPMSVRANPFQSHAARHATHAVRFTEGGMVAATPWPDDESFTHVAIYSINDHPSLQGQDPDPGFPRTMPTVTPPPSGSRPVSPRASMQRSHAHRVSFRTSMSPKSGATRNSSVTTNGCGAFAEGESCQICGGGRCRTCGCRSI